MLERSPRSLPLSTPDQKPNSKKDKYKILNCICSGLKSPKARSSHTPIILFIMLLLGGMLGKLSRGFFIKLGLEGIQSIPSVKNSKRHF